MINNNINYNNNIFSAVEVNIESKAVVILIFLKVLTKALTLGFLETELN